MPMAVPLVRIACRAIRETYTGAVVEIVAVSRDITLRIEAQENLAHSARVATLGELASGIAHEINQPLAAVLNYSNASLRYLNNLEHDPQARERVAQGLQRINQQATHAAEVIRRLRAFLRKARPLQALDIAQVAGEALACAPGKRVRRRWHRTAAGATAADGVCRSGVAGAGAAQPAAQCHRRQP
jgi:C4-dicarboxylate-specific signal transduction histidine kinase